MPTEEEIPYHFPTTLHFKIIARREAEIEKIVRERLTEAGFDHTKLPLTIRPSRQNTYWAITVPVYLTSKAQLDTLHRVMNEHPAIVMTL